MVFHGSVKGTSQCISSIGGNVWWQKEWAAEFLPHQNELQRLAVGLRLRKVQHHREVRKIRMTPQSPLRDDANLFFLEPIRVERLQRRPGGSTDAEHLATFHRKMDFRCAFITSDDLKLCSDQSIEKHRIVVLARAGELCADDNLRREEVLKPPH